MTERTPVLYGPNNLPVAAAAVEERALSESASYFLTGRDMPRVTGVTDRTAYAKVPWVYRCVQVIATSIAMNPFVLEDTRGDDPVRLPDSDPRTRPFRRPSYRKSGHDLWMTTVGSYLLAGNAILRLDFGGQIPRQNLPPTNIIPLNPRNVSVLVDQMGKLVGYEHTLGHTRATFSPEEIVHIQQYNPESDTWGLSTLSAALLAANLDTLSADFNAQFFKNAAQLGGLLISKKRLTDAQLEQVREQFNARHRGVNNAHQTGVLQGEWEYHATGIAQAEMQLLQQREFNRDTIAATFGVPSLFLNKIADVNRSTSETQWRILYESTVMPIITAIEQALETQLFEPYMPGTLGRFDLSEAPGMRDDVQQKIANAQALWAMGVPLNDIKAMLKFDFPDYAWGNTWWVPIGMVPADPEAAAAFAATPDEEEPDEEPEEESPEDDEPEEKAFATQREFTAEELREIYWRAFVKQIAPLENKLSARYKRHVMELRREVLENLAKAGEPPQTKSVETRESFKDFINRVVFNKSAANRKLRAWYETYVDQALKIGGKQVVSDLGGDADFSMNTPQVLEFKDRRLKLSPRINDTLYDHVVESLKTGLEEGATIEEIKEAIKGDFNNATSRARTVARTEVATAVNQGRVQSMLQNDVTQHQWLSSRDNAVRHPPDDESNHLIDGEEVKIGQRFSNGLRWPNDDTGSAEATINCRCVSIPSLNE